MWNVHGVNKWHAPSLSSDFPEKKKTLILSSLFFIRARVLDGAIYPKTKIERVSQDEDSKGPPRQHQHQLVSFFDV